MERVNRILRHPLFSEELSRLADMERERAFCGHGIAHLLDVARIAYILNLEDRMDQEKELVYAAALLHDTGRARQYEDGTPHEKESARISAGILPDCGYSEQETALILDAILAHRSGNTEVRQGLAEILYRADKLSRRCFDGADEPAPCCPECSAADICDWEMKNRLMEY